MFSLFLVARAHSFFPTLEEKKHTRKNTKCNVLHSRAFALQGAVRHALRGLCLCLNDRQFEL